MRRRTSAALVVFLLAAGPALAKGSTRLTDGPTTAWPPSLLLREGWQVRSFAEVDATAAEVSTPGFATAGWTSTTVPTTVLGALVRSGEIPDPYYGRNLETIPAARFAVPWWFRTEVDVAAPLAASSRLVFNGINYSAEVWLNGTRLATRDQLYGAFRRFELDVTRTLHVGKNVLAVVVFPPQPGDFTIGFVDWNPEPPDRSMGLWREVELRRSGPVSLDDVFVRSDFDVERPTVATLDVEALLANRGDAPVEAILHGELVGGGTFSQVVKLGPHEQRAVRLGADEAPALRVASPRLWWPHNLGAPNLYRMALAVEASGPSDWRRVDFGIRKVADYLDEKQQRGYLVNGKKVLVRGAGWVDDLLLADSDQRLEDQMRYVQHLNLNTVRFEGFWDTTHEIYDLADRLGLMVWVGWSCQWEWHHYLGAPVDVDFGGVDTAPEIDLVTRSLRDQVLRLRNHPSVVVWNLGSDMLPHPDAERSYRAVLAELDPTRPPLSSCSTRVSEVSGPSGVKMNGPYEWEPPDYWYVDKEHGGAFGFNTETGPGAQPPVAASIRRMMPKEHWWPIDDMWSFHSGRHEFKNIDRYRAALDARYGPSNSLEEFAKKSQVASYEAMRPMFESFARRFPDTKGVVQWMLNSAWPEMYWQLYDWYLVPTGAFYAARNANRPVNVVYDYGERKVVAINDTGAPVRARAVVRVLDPASKVLRDESAAVELAPGARRELATLGPPPAGAPVVFLDARLLDERGAALAQSFYWLPSEPDVLDWEKGEWFYTPVSRYADLSAVTKLPAASVDVSHRFSPAADGQAVDVTLTNRGDTLAFFVELSVVGAKSGQIAAPVLWDDNYVSLLPGERRTLHASVPAHALAGEAPALRWEGMNVAAGP